jgi:hypothetical protein
MLSAECEKMEAASVIGEKFHVAAYGAIVDRLGVCSLALVWIVLPMRSMAVRSKTIRLIIFFAEIMRTDEHADFKPVDVLLGGHNILGRSSRGRVG